MLSVSELHQFYGGSHTLRDVSFEARGGEVTAVLGRNGVGKTTLLKCIAGLLPAKRGAITFDGHDVTRLPPYKRAQLGLGYVPQGREIFPRLTVEENLQLGLATKRSSTPIPGRVFEMFPVLREMLHRRGGDLSGGQQQQLAMGRALAIDPKLLILDEPTEGIQPNIVSQIADVLGELRRQGLTILLVEQKLPFARRVADRFCILDRGRAVASGPMSELDDGVVSRYLTV